MEYVIRYTDKVPSLGADFDAGPWASANTLSIDIFRPEGSAYCPKTEAKLLYDSQKLYVKFRVLDEHVRSVMNHFQDSVCTDSCVEFFVQPGLELGYFNFEFNCGGFQRSAYVVNHTATGGPYNYTLLVEGDRKFFKVHHSMPELVEPEISEPTEWHLAYSVDYGIFEKYKKIAPPKSGDKWRGNFYKCGDKTSHPHWGSWAPLSTFKFHNQESFGSIIFE